MSFWNLIEEGSASELRDFLDQQPVGFNVDQLNTKGDPAILIVARRGILPIVEVLVDAGANVNALNLKQSSAIIVAALNGHESVVSYLISRGANVNQSTDSGDSALSLAIWQNHTECCLVLLDHGSNVNHIDSFGDCPLLDAAKHGNFAVVEKILDKQTISINHQNKKGDTALIRASWKGNVQTLRLLLDRGADPCILNKINASALTFACMQSHSDCIKVLAPLSRRVLDELDDQQCSPLIYLMSGRQFENATSKYDWESMDLLIELGCKLDSPADNVGSTLLHKAVNFGSVSTVRLLVKSPAVDVNYLLPPPYLCSTLQTHIRNYAGQPRMEIIRTLIEGGANVDLTTPSGETPLMLAAKYNSLSIFNMLLEHGANIMLLADNGSSALSCALKSDEPKGFIKALKERSAARGRLGDLFLQAACFNQLEMVKELLNESVDINWVDSNGRTALMIAAKNRANNDVVEYLLARCAALDVCDSNGENALAIAIKFGNEEAAELIVNATVAQQEREDDQKREEVERFQAALESLSKALEVVR